MNMKTKALSVFLAMLFATSASAITLKFDDTTSATTNAQHTGASAEVTLMFSDNAVGEVQVDIMVKNTTGETTFGAGATTSTLTGFAFNAINGYSVLLSSVGSALDTFLTNVGNPSTGTFEWAFADNNNWQGGNANNGLMEGATDSMALLLSTGTDDAADVEAAYASMFAAPSLGRTATLRYQQVNAGAGSDKLTWTGDDMTPVPLPAAGWMLIAAVGGLGAMRRRQK